MKGGFVSIMSNRPNGTVYVGVTADIIRRAWEHRTCAVIGFTQRYGLTRLVYLERHEEIVTAIRREKAIKGWDRAWKVRLIQRLNPERDDLYPTLFQIVRAPPVMAGEGPPSTAACGPSQGAVEPSMPHTLARSRLHHRSRGWWAFAHHDGRGGVQTSCRTSVRRPVTAAAAAIAGDTRWVRPPCPCRPSKLRFEVLAHR
jgi:putative endonuclease